MVCAAAGLGTAIPLIAAGVMLGRVSTNPLGKLGSAVVLILTLLAMLAGSTGLALRIDEDVPGELGIEQDLPRRLRGVEVRMVRKLQDGPNR